MWHRQVAADARRILERFGHEPARLAPALREPLAVAKSVLRSTDALLAPARCADCWLPKPACICAAVRASREPLRAVRRIFMVLHHRELGLTADTSRLLRLAFPSQVSLAVAGLPGVAWREVQESMESGRALVLFPAAGARAIAEAAADGSSGGSARDVIIPDGTWAQAKRINRKLGGGAALRVELGGADVEQLGADRRGWQARGSEGGWRRVATLEATRRALAALGEDADATQRIASAHRIAHRAYFEARGRREEV